MSYSTLISASELHQHSKSVDWVIMDCRFSLSQVNAGAYAYRHGHLANARYADLNKDLSSAVTSRTGRHPLPDFRELAKKLGSWGISNQTQVIVYDDASGAFAGRLWWLLRCLGHQQVAVLDGGIQAWQRQKYPITTVLPVYKAKIYRPYLDNYQWVTADQLENSLASKAVCLLDARTSVRYRGQNEPIDPVAGHIRGAINRPLQLNLDADGLFLSPAELKKQFLQLIKIALPEQVVHSCGSGVSACHNLLAMEHAGLTGSKLYAGSWSEWITNKNRSVVRF